ncbi:MAG TPA: NAD-dependent DNA ligase LigA [Pelovirga sp.]|nr:NAD-dependent DNA ligase LigA [Pelovirga sp.]
MAADFKENPQTDFRKIEHLSKKQAREEIEALREGIEYHNHCYYVKNDPVISDATYDKLFQRLQKLEEAFPELQSDNSPTRRIGAAPVAKLKRITHHAPMLSLNAVLEENDIEEWFDFVTRSSKEKNHKYVVEPKFDGVSVEVVYEDGRFQYGATRGDGQTGEDISANLRTVRSLPLQLQSQDIPRMLSLRAEIFLPQEAFQQINQERLENGQEPFANPRNACAGIVRRLASKTVAQRPLDIYFYEILHCEGQEFSSHWKKLEAFAEWGLKTNPHNKIFSDHSKITTYREKLIALRDELGYEIDGIVIKVNSHQIREQLGTRHRSPRWAIAWKFAPKQEITRLEKIVVQVGTSGILTPVALLQPVDVGGVTVSRATLHNADEIRKKDLRKGDRVRIARAGDVIPEVIERIERPNKNAHKFHMPDQCPSCETNVIREGAYFICPADLRCPAQLRGRLQHYGSREALDITHLGEKTVGQLVQRNMVTSLADLYHLNPEDLEKLDLFGNKNARQLYEAIQETKKPRLDRFLYALGIRHVGRRMAQILAEKFTTFDNIRQASREQLIEIQDVGEKIADSLISFFSENQETLEDLEDAGVKVQKMPGGNEGKLPLKEKTLVFTGSLENYTRSEAQQAVEDLGGHATSSISSHTDYLVRGVEPGQKLDEAKEKDVTILDEKGFRKLLSSAENK